MKQTCPICTEQFGINHPPHKQSCCNHTLCKSCLHSHIHSIFTEATTGDGRTKLTCPFGCGAELNDGTIRNTIHYVHYTIRHGILWYILYWIVYWIIPFKLFLRIRGWDLERIHSFTNYELWTRWTKSEAERKDLDLYERWSLTVGLSTRSNRLSTSSSNDNEDSEYNDDHDTTTLLQSTSSTDTPSNIEIKQCIPITGDANDYYTHVTRCPRPGCECLWLTSEPYYNSKQRHEKKHQSKSHASNWLFYSPPKPDKELKLLQKGGYTNEHWLYSHEIDLFDSRRRDDLNSRRGLDGTILSNERQERYHTNGEDTDGRRVACPKCHYTFCALCYRPWSSYTRAQSRKNNLIRSINPLASNLQTRIHHTDRTCASYQSKTVSSDDDDFVQLGDELDCRSCPRCSMRASRISGCNHMTCVCGFEWCYVCECRWNQFHYGCTDHGQRRQDDTDNGCIVS